MRLRPGNPSIDRTHRNSSRRLIPTPIMMSTRKIRSSDRTPREGYDMSRWISHGPRAVFGSTLAAGLTLILASAGLAPAMSEPDGPAGPSRGVEGMRRRSGRSSRAPRFGPGRGHDAGAPSRAAGRDGGLPRRSLASRGRRRRAGRSRCVRRLRGPNRPVSAGSRSGAPRSGSIIPPRRMPRSPCPRPTIPWDSSWSWPTTGGSIPRRSRSRCSRAVDPPAPGGSAPTPAMTRSG